MESIVTILGKLHPLWVHLPVGVLLLTIFFQWLSNKEKYAGLIVAIRPAYLVGMVTAAAAVVSGWLLADSGTYSQEADILFTHRWLGIGVLLLSAGGYWMQPHASRLVQNIWAGVLLMVVTAAGHYGGTLTHGEGYLWTATPAAPTQVIAPITSAQDAAVYAQLVQPVLNSKCVGCHGPKKQKGKLRLDDSSYLLKGGEHGVVFKMGLAAESELFKRITLDPLEEKHMPPKGKPALTEQEIQLITWWINSGAGWHTKVKELAQPEPIKNWLKSLESPIKEKRSLIPEMPVAAAAEKIIASLQAAGVVIVPVAANSNYLSASMINMPAASDSVIQLLQQLQAQIIWMKADYLPATEQIVNAISSLSNLTRLSWAHGKLTDKYLPAFRSLSQLQYLNLSNNPISRDALFSLQSLPKLQSLYIWNTKIVGNEIAALASAFPHTQLDTGNYRLAMIAADTIPVKAPPVK
ncbi:MAG: hypothetical protein NTZ47_08985 [Bacteroidetes bacterium]|nr:hypothetical protein [Bacteroidota bacterium]